MSARRRRGSSGCRTSCPRGSSRRSSPKAYIPACSRSSRRKNSFPGRSPGRTPGSAGWSPRGWSRRPRSPRRCASASSGGRSRRSFRSQDPCRSVRRAPSSPFRLCGQPALAVNQSILAAGWGRIVRTGGLSSSRDPRHRRSSTGPGRRVLPVQDQPARSECVSSTTASTASPSEPELNVACLAPRATSASRVMPRLP